VVVEVVLDEELIVCDALSVMTSVKDVIGAVVFVDAVCVSNGNIVVLGATVVVVVDATAVPM
jgi:hypothetical protein